MVPRRGAHDLIYPLRACNRPWQAAICGRLIGAYEAERGVAFEWVLKTRPDFMLLAPWPRFSAQFPSRAIVYLNKKRADHFFLCPRARCGPYFGGSAQQVSCATGPDFGFYSHLRVGFMGYDALDVGDIVYQYAFFRGTDPGRDATDSGLVCKSAVDKEVGMGRCSISGVCRRPLPAARRTLPRSLLRCALISPR